ncbi:hypothetical protein MASR2M18_05340 [Ignavibacteria bacterium]|nr:LPS export ABC transporter periplasmic protein LptC [Bacteroidota bacterium]MCZ2133762.1 LPS export ABC transporter periplasmic protein LptC [Bacteroidota bacterium]
MSTAIINSRYLIFLVLVTAFVGCKNEAGDKKSVAVEVDIPIHTIWDFSMTLMDSSRIKATISSARAIVNEKGQETTLDSAVKVEFMSVYSRRVGMLTSDSAKIDDRTRNMFAYGNVKVVSDSTNVILTTPMLMWNNGKQLLFTTEKVHIVTPTEIIDGIGFESDQYLKNYKIFRVSGIKHLQ